jgi:hypothetical protein
MLVLINKEEFFTNYLTEHFPIPAEQAGVIARHWLSVENEMVTQPEPDVLLKKIDQFIHEQLMDLQTPVLTSKNKIRQGKIKYSAQIPLFGTDDASS